METTEIDIIYWTTWFGSNQWQDHKINHCNLPYTCKMTHDRSKAVESSVMIFHASDMDGLKNMPPQLDNRAWVYHNAESPKNTPEILDVMQYSMTYQLNSDFPWGYLNKKTLISRMETSLPEKKRNNMTDAPVAWIVSNCKATNYRHRYVQELKKYIDIDIYGHCISNREYPENTSTIELISKYYFYLSMENSNCKDYVTEKLSNAYLAGTVPIVDGPSDYGPFIPTTHSVIRTDQFKSPKELANYLNLLLQNKSLYDEYLSFRRIGGLSNRFKNTLNIYENSMCDLCSLAHERYTNMSLYYPGKKIYLDNTCVSHKHIGYGNTRTFTFYLPISLFTFIFILFFFKSTFYYILGYRKNNNRG